MGGAMKLNAQDWRKLQIPLICLCFTLLVVAALCAWANHYMNKQALLLQTQTNTFNQARSQYQASGLEKQNIIENLPQYQQLINMGLVGEERRIEWVEGLRETHKQYKLFSINYEIGQQEVYKPSFMPNIGNFILHRSIMKLNFPMLHEGDILSLIEGLKSHQTTPFIVRDCILTRQYRVVNLKALTPNQAADCEIDWITIREPTLEITAP